MNKKCLLIFVILLLTFGNLAYARSAQSIDDWYIKKIDTTILVNKDSSLLITEYITADCGDLSDKHGIFRILPVRVNTEKGTFKTPIELISITDFNGRPYKYQTIKNSSDGTVTWKIGDPDVMVHGENLYKISYRVKNAVRFINPDFDELYWNLLGTYWQIDVDDFSAQILFPEEISRENTAVDYYTGAYGSKNKSLAIYEWNKNVLVFNSTRALRAMEGITVSVTFSKGIFTPYEFSFLEKYGQWFWLLTLLIPVAVFFLSFHIWNKYGKDPRMKSPIPPEFGVPKKITPIQMGMVISGGRWENNLITAAIIDLAVRGFITIEEEENKILFLKQKAIKLIKNKTGVDESSLSETEKVLLRKLFGGKDTVNMADLRNKFSKKIKDIKKSAERDVVQGGWITKKGLSFIMYFFVTGFILCSLSFSMIVFVPQLFFSFFLSGIILIFFSFFMPKRTQAGTDLMFQIKGFNLYMQKAEDYRQQFYEKENIFDKFLPYAIVFGIAGLWAKKMQIIYGQDFYKNYHPVWFVGTSVGSFDLDSFTSQLNSITSSISSGTSSGAGGSGGSGGGGGGGGGGGW